MPDAPERPQLPEPPARPDAVGEVSRPSLLRLAGTVLGLGVVVGLVWYLVAPTPPYRVAAGGLFPTSSQPSEYIAMDGSFGLLGLVAGTATGVLAVRWRRTDVASVVVLALGGLAAAVIAWRFGHLLGPGEPRATGALVRDTVVHGPLDLEARGVLVAWPAASLVVLLLVLGWRRPDVDEPGADEPGADAPESPGQFGATGR